ncbi:hypothetical protein BKA69DRAFT_765144 [Paraphysoderma sedebokerense]|nr:hypothetical protein BKA69DRAFT_1127236 [Paraphysoderma sedebokerense]KAI9138603.1 hypothetical protein BKA69DRAFT_765144 [Paraphysoderma sedebokerense]
MSSKTMKSFMSSAKSSRRSNGKNAIKTNESKQNVLDISKLTFMNVTTGRPGKRQKTSNLDNDEVVAPPVTSAFSLSDLLGAEPDLESSSRRLSHLPTPQTEQSRRVSIGERADDVESSPTKSRLKSKQIIAAENKQGKAEKEPAALQESYTMESAKSVDRTRDSIERDIKIPKSKKVVGEKAAAPTILPAFMKHRNLLERVNAKLEKKNSSAKAISIPKVSKDKVILKRSDDDEDAAVSSIDPHRMPHIQKSAAHTFSTGSASTTPNSKRSISSLAQLLEPSLKVKLPESYKHLEQLFHGLEYVLMFMKGRDHSCNFHKIKKAVENSANRTFELKHLAQIKTVFPEAYIFDAVKAICGGEKVETVLIDFHFDWNKSKCSEITPLSTPSTPTKAQKPSPVTTPRSGGRQLLTPTKKRTASQKDEAELEVDLRAFRHASFAGRDLELRRKEFRRRLIELVKAEHEIFLQQNSLELKSAASTNLWHPDFDLNSVPDIPKSPLPKIIKPVVDVKKILNLQSSHIPESVKAKLITTTSVSDSAQKEENNVKQKSDDTKQQSHTVSSKEAGYKKPSKFSDLLERIKAKEQKRTLELNNGLSSEQFNRRLMLSRLPFIIDTMSFAYNSLNKNVMSMNDISKKVVTSYRTPLSQADAILEIELLSNIAPQFCAITKVGQTRMVRIQKNMLVSMVKDIVTAEMEKIKPKSEEPCV